MVVILWFIGVWVLTRNVTTAYMWGVLIIISTAVSIFLIIMVDWSITKELFIDGIVNRRFNRNQCHYV